MRGAGLDEFSNKGLQPSFPNGEEFFNDPVWDKYIPTNSLSRLPARWSF
jgi:hypothetical protein